MILIFFLVIESKKAKKEEERIERINRVLPAQRAAIRREFREEKKKELILRVILEACEEFVLEDSTPLAKFNQNR